MADFEIFSGFDTADQMDEKSFERFREQMKSNSAQMASDQRQEQRQKEKEDKLIAILLKFMKRNQKMHLILLISRCLEENIPAAFILSVVLLGNEDIQEEAGIKLALPEEDMKLLSAQEMSEKEDGQTLIQFDPDKPLLPLKLKIAIDLWGRNIFEMAQMNPKKILQRVHSLNSDGEKTLKEVLLKLTAVVLRDYMTDHGVSGEYHDYHQFAEFMMKGIMKKLAEQIEGQKELKG